MKEIPGYFDDNPDHLSRGNHIYSLTEFVLNCDFEKTFFQNINVSSSCISYI